MKKDLKTILSNVGFYSAMAAALTVIGVGGYSLLAPTSTETVSDEISVSAKSDAVAAPSVNTEPIAAERPERTGLPTKKSSPEPEIVMSTTAVADAPITAEEPQLVVSPLRGEVLTAFSVDELFYNETLDDWRIHDGIDIAAKPGTPVLAACAGTVLSVKDDALMGTTVVIEHANGYQTTYSNLQSTPNVLAGDTVTAGQTVGAVGQTAASESHTAPHLHLSVTQDGDVIDPREFLDQ